MNRNNTKRSRFKPKKTRSRQEAKAKAEAEYEKAVKAHTMICRECSQEVYVLDIIASERNGLCAMCYSQQILSTI